MQRTISIPAMWGSDRFSKDDAQIVIGKDLIRQNAFTTYPSDWVYRYQDAGHVDIARSYINV